MIPIFPLGSCFLPGEFVPLRIFEDRYLQMLIDLVANAQMSGDNNPPQFGTVLIERGREVGGGDTRAPIGTMLSVCSVQWAPRFDQARIVGFGENVIEIVNWHPDTPYPRAEVMIRETPSGDSDQDLYELVRTNVMILQQLAIKIGHQNERIEIPPFDTNNFEKLVWKLCTSAPLLAIDRYSLLQCTTNNERLELLNQHVMVKTDIFKFDLS